MFANDRLTGCSAFPGLYMPGLRTMSPEPVSNHHAQV